MPVTMAATGVKPWRWSVAEALNAQLHVFSADGVSQGQSVSQIDENCQVWPQWVAVTNRLVEAERSGSRSRYVRLRVLIIP